MSAFVPDLAVATGGLPIALRLLLLAVTAGYVGLQIGRTLAAKRAAVRAPKAGDEGQAS